jgi:hypothetical protein
VGVSKRGLYFVLFADKEQLADFRIGLQCDFDPIDDNPASVVTTHDIDCDSHKKKERSRKIQPRSPKNELSRGFDSFDLTAFVKSARGTDPMRKGRRGALRTDAQLRQS